jgi:tetratricopeptide (TPR) repeat protein
MSNRNALIVALLILGGGVAVLVAAYFGRGASPTGEFDKGQRFTAKPGTTRENAMLLTSSKRASTDDPKDAIARRAENLEDDSDPLEVKSLSKPEEDPLRAGPAGETAREALNSFSPEAGLRKLDEALSLPSLPEQAAILHEAKGQLYAQMDPPDYARALESLEKAAALAEDPALREQIQYEAAQILFQAGLVDEAREQLESAREAKAAPSDMQYKRQLLQGQLLEQEGELEEAENLYQAVLDATEALPDHLDKDAALALARIAGMRLSNLYRRNDRDQAADALALDLRKRFARMQAQ